MTTDETRENLLGPVIARLRELEKKCASMGSRNEEFPLMQRRLASIIKRLKIGREPTGAPISYRAIAKEIFPIAHLFESVGFMSVGREVAHIEKILNDLEPATPEPADEPPAQATVKAASTSARISAESTPSIPEPNAVAEEDEASASGSNLPWPVLFAFLVLLVAAGISGSLIFKIGPFREIPPTPIPSPTATAMTATPSPLPTTPPIPTTGTRSQIVSLADELSQARLAFARDDLDGAVSHLSAAAMLDRDNTAVLEIAEQLVHRLVAEADAETEMARWTMAEDHLERARRIAMRFGIETTVIDTTERRHAAMDRFVIVGPDDTAALRSGQGKRALVTLADRQQQSGRIEGVARGVLFLEVDSDVGGGFVRFTDEIPLDTVTSIRIYED